MGLPYIKGNPNITRNKINQLNNIIINKKGLYSIKNKDNIIVSTYSYGDNIIINNNNLFLINSISNENIIDNKPFKYFNYNKNNNIIFKGCKVTYILGYSDTKKAIDNHVKLIMK